MTTDAPRDGMAKAGPLLSGLPKGSKVAVVETLGSFCPIHLGHVEMFKAAKAQLLRRGYAEVLGRLSLNPDVFVERKFDRSRRGFLTEKHREELVHLATREYDWLGFDDGYPLTRMFPDLHFTPWDMNGADDVVKYGKWRWASEDSPMLVVGRAGSTGELLRKMRADGVQPSDHLILCEESETTADFSSTEARKAVLEGREEESLRYLHRDVYRRMVELAHP